MTASFATEDGSLHTGTARGRWVLAATIAGSSAAMLDATVVNVALARIGAELDVGFAGLQWIANAYTLTLASFILLGGVLGDRYGRRRVFVVGMIWFAAASALCALSVNEAMLITARALQGIGGALLTPGSLAIISASFAAEDRGRAIGTWSGLGGIAAAAGPFLGGWLVTINWRLVFLINLPLAVLVVLIAVRHVPETRQAASAARLDLPGTAAMIVALSTLTYGLMRAGQLGWDALAVGGCLVGVIAAAVFVVWELHTPDPLIALGMFAQRVFAATNVVTLFLYAALGVYFFLLVLELQMVSGWSPLAAGTSLLPVTLAMLLLSSRFGALAERTGPRPLMTLGSVLAAAAFTLSLRIGPDASYLGDVLPAAATLGLGLSLTVAPLTAAVLGSVPDDLAGAASGVNNAVARTSGLLAVVVVPALAGMSAAGPGDTAALQAGFGVAMIIGAGLCLLAAAVSWFGVGPLRTPDTETPQSRQRIAVHRHTHCAVAGPPVHPNVHEP